MISSQDRTVTADAFAAQLERLSGRLMLLFAVQENGNTRQLSAIVRTGEGLIRLRAPLRGAYPAVTPRVPAAHWFEREIHDLYAITPEGHPRLEPLIRHAPDRGEVELPEEEDVRPQHRGAQRLGGAGVFVIPYGPVRSGVFEAAQFLIQTGGEDVAYCAQRLLLKRRSAERRISEVPLNLAVLVAERVCRNLERCPCACLLPCGGVWLAETEVPPRAQVDTADPRGARVPV